MTTSSDGVRARRFWGNAHVGLVFRLILAGVLAFAVDWPQAGHYSVTKYRALRGRVLEGA